MSNTNLRSIIRLSMEEAQIGRHGAIDPDVNSTTAGGLANNPDIAAEQPTVGLFGAVGTNWHNAVMPLLDIPAIAMGAEPPKPPVQVAATDEAKGVLTGKVENTGENFSPNDVHHTEGNEVGAAVAQTESGALNTGSAVPVSDAEPTASVGAESQQLDAAAATALNQDASAAATVPVPSPEYSMYVLTPEDIGYRSVAQVAAAAVNNPAGTIVAFAPGSDGRTFADDAQSADEIGAVKALLSDAGANVFDTLTASVEFLNSKKR